MTEYLPGPLDIPTAESDVVDIAGVVTVLPLARAVSTVQAAPASTVLTTAPLLAAAKATLESIMRSVW